jgi:protein-L-isoaspartate(D-aspartate) O-methyltransferase
VAADVNQLREDLASSVIARQHVTSGLIAAALRDVPRHLFLPELPPDRAYQDEAIVTMRDADGIPVSSSSAPSMMAIMLDQLDLRRGQRVLEIGAGTGYNAALLAHITGPGGAVVSVDIEPEAIARARQALDRAGYPDVTLISGDGAEGYPEGGPYDRLIATVGIGDLAPAWLAQLTPRARIVAPLDIRGAQCSVALDRDGDHWISRSVSPCGFIRMRGSLAGAAAEREPGFPGDLLTAVPDCEISTGVRASGRDIFGGLSLWLAVRDPRWVRVDRHDRQASEPAGKRLTGQEIAHIMVARITQGLADGGSGATLRLTRTQPDGYEITVDGFGRAAAALAGALAGEVRAWDAAGRPYASSLRITAFPHGTGGPASTADPGVIERPHTTFTVEFPPVSSPFTES